MTDLDMVLREIWDLHTDVRELYFGTGSVTFFGFHNGTDWVRANDGRPVVFAIRTGTALQDVLPLILAPKSGVTMQPYPNKNKENKRA